MGNKGMKLAGNACLGGGKAAAGKLAGPRLAARAIGASLGAGLLACVGFSGAAQAQLVRPVEKVKYDNKFDAYLGMSLDTVVAGRNLEARMNLGGAEAQGTYWMFPRVGFGLDLRADAGTTPVLPNPFGVNRAVVYQEMALAGAQVRGPKNQHFALDYHGYFGVTRGVFNADIGAKTPQQVGLYSNRTKPMAALGISLDINRGAHWALRIQPDAMIREYGSHDVTEDFSMSAGVLYRFGKKR